ncbi:MAG: hypothetical protein RI988_3458 [Pseudomonadota bacterium]|jgi:hypothetical protein
MTFTRENLEALIAECGSFLPADAGYRECADLDGQAAHLFLQALGYSVLGHQDRHTHGCAYTACGVILSTNGFVHRDINLAWKLHRKA